MHVHAPYTFIHKLHAEHSFRPWVLNYWWILQCGVCLTTVCSNAMLPFSACVTRMCLCVCVSSSMLVSSPLHTCVRIYEWVSVRRSSRSNKVNHKYFRKINVFFFTMSGVFNWYFRAYLPSSSICLMNTVSHMP